MQKWGKLRFAKSIKIWKCKGILIFFRLEEFAEENYQRVRIKEAISNNNVFLAGDLNMGFPGENKALDEYGFHDLWLEKYSHFNGFTWDPLRNKILTVINPFDDRRSRLDRIWLK